MNYIYCSTDDISNYFGNRIIFGTSGSALMGTMQAQEIIGRVSERMDYDLTHIYGTIRPLFGTNGWGTLGTIPNEIVAACIDLSVGIIMQNTWRTITKEQADWARNIYDRGTTLLHSLATGYAFVAPFAGTVQSNMTMDITNEYGTQMGEAVTLNANPYMLIKRKIIKGAMPPVVYGTIGTVMGTYSEGTHYTINYWGGALHGQDYGYVQAVGTWSFNALIDYLHFNDRIFTLRDNFHWGQWQNERR